MIKIFTGLLLVLLCLNILADEIKIGYVDGVKLIERAPQGDAAKATLEAEFKPRELQIISLRDQIRELEEALNTDKEPTDVSDDDIVQVRKKIRDQRRDLKRIQQEMREDLNLRRNEELAKLQRLISKAIIEMAKVENFDLIIQDAVYAAASIDITGAVLDKLNNAFEAGE